VKKNVIMLGFIMMLLAGTGVSAGEYLLQPSDVLSINVYGYPELSFTELNIRPDGIITYPLAGKISIEKLTADGLAEVIKARMQDYMMNPLVTVNVVKFRGTQVYVVGEVKNPGVYGLDKGQTLLDGLGKAGGWTKDAAKTKVFIIHKDNKGDPLRINLMELLKKGDVSKNPILSEGDTVYLTGNGRLDFVQDVVPLLNAIISAGYYWNNK